MLAVALGMGLGACSDRGLPPEDLLKPKPDDSDLVPPPVDSMEIKVRNLSERVQYVRDPESWLLSETASVRNVDLGDLEPPVDLALNTNQPECDSIRRGELACGQHGDRAPSAVAIAPGAEYVATWAGFVWKRTHLAGEPDCICVERVAAPAGAYRVSLRVGSEMACSDDECSCDWRATGSCIAYGPGPVERELERRVSFPEQREVVLELD
jgi:hypothetical protein